MDKKRPARLYRTRLRTMDYVAIASAVREMDTIDDLIHRLCDHFQHDCMFDRNQFKLECDPSFKSPT